MSLATVPYILSKFAPEPTVLYVHISSHPLTCMSLYDITVNVKPSALFPPPGPEVEGVCKYGGVGLPTLLSCLSSGCLV